MNKLEVYQKKIDLLMINIDILSKKSNIIYWTILIVVVGFISLHSVYEDYIFQELDKLLHIPNLNKDINITDKILKFKDQVDTPRIYILGIGIMLALLAIFYLISLWIEILMYERKIKRLRKKIFSILEKKR